MATGPKGSEQKKVQFTLAKFFKPESQPQLALAEWKPEKRGRGRPPKNMPLEVLRAEEEALKAAEEEHEDRQARMKVLAAFRNRASSRGVAGGWNSNRVQHHQKRQKHEITTAAKVAVIAAMKAARCEYASEADWMVQMMRQYALRKQQIEEWLSKEDDYKNILKSAGFKVRGKGIARRSASEKAIKMKGGLAIRRQGAGRKDICSEMKAGVRQWLDAERSHGHFVDKEDLYDEFIDQVNGTINSKGQQVRNLLDDFKKKDVTKELIEFQILKRKASVVELQDRLDKLKNSKKYRESFTARLMLDVGGKQFKPQRVTTLSMDEECTRALATWQQLSRHVSNPKSWIENRDKTVLLFSDQVPFWCKIGAGNQVYCEAEVQAKKVRRDVSFGQSSHSLDILDEELEMDAKAAAESSLRRGLAHSEQTKFRVTYEATQAVLGYFSKDQPIGVVFRGLLVVSGVHARLSNISAEGKWIEDEEFVYKNKRTVRKAGKAAGRILESFRKIRTLRPELFEGITVMSQPSAFVDSVIFHWNQIELSKHVVQSVSQRDLFGGALSPTAKASCATGQCLSSWIQGSMTAVLQLTDTDFSFSFKSSARSVMSKLRKEMKLKAAAEGVQATFKCGAYEIMRITSEAHAEQVTRNNETDWVLKGLRRNMMLSMRPDFEKGFTVKNAEEWASQMPEGSYRLRKEWMDRRYEHVNQDGSLQKTEFSALTDAKRLAEEAELENCKQSGLYKDEAGQTIQDQSLELEFEDFDDEQNEFIESAKLSELLAGNAA